MIFAPSVGWAIELAQRPHHLARVLAQNGYAVVFDSSNAHDDVDTLREIEPRLFLYKGAPGALAELPRTILWTFSYNYDYRDAFPPDARVVYDWIDDLAVFPYDQGKLAALHARALRESDLVISVARRLHEDALRVRPDARYVPNAVEAGRFEAEPRSQPRARRSRVRGDRRGGQADRRVLRGARATGSTTTSSPRRRAAGPTGRSS